MLGVLVVARPGAAAFRPAAVFVLLSSLSWATASVLSRKIAHTERATTTVLWAAVTGLVLLTLLMPVEAVWPRPLALVLALVLGVVASGGQYFMVLAYRHAGASLLAPFSYLQLIWATALGWLVFWQLAGCVDVGGWRHHRGQRCTWSVGAGGARRANRSDTDGNIKGRGSAWRPSREGERRASREDAGAAGCVRRIGRRTAFRLPRRYGDSEMVCKARRVTWVLGRRAGPGARASARWGRGRTAAGAGMALRPRVACGRAWARLAGARLGGEGGEAEHAADRAEDAAGVRDQGQEFDGGGLGEQELKLAAAAGGLPTEGADQPAAAGGEHVPVGAAMAGFMRGFGRGPAARRTVRRSKRRAARVMRVQSGMMMEKKRGSWRKRRATMAARLARMMPSWRARWGGGRPRPGRGGGWTAPKYS